LDIGRVIGEVGGRGTVRFKVGMARCVFERWAAYVEDVECFTHMFVLVKTATREGACYLESALIAFNWNEKGCVNEERRDAGGTGSGSEGPHAVYLVARRVGVHR
jgi:hypothetical protein